MAHQSNETLRKAIHIAFGLGALTLRWLPWWAAAGVAAVAVVSNFLVLHRIVGRSVARHERGWDEGIVLYPLAVLLLIVLFRDNLAIAAIAWAILAFGDGFATLAGKGLRGPALPWNPQKTWSGFLAFGLAGSLAALFVWKWMGGIGDPTHVVVAVLCAAVVESLRTGVDDNLTVPVAAAVALTFFTFSPWGPFALLPYTVTLLIANTVLAAAGYLLRSVSVSGALGGWVLGAIIILGAGWPMYASLLAFFVIGSATTKLGYRRKAAAGLAQEGEGRRGFSHAFANVGVAAICAIFFSRWARTHYPVGASLVVYVMGIASLATAAADTTASEIGQLVGRRTFLPLTFRRVPPGTEGAISVEGTLAGLVAALVVAWVGTTSLESMLYGSLLELREGFVVPTIVLITIAAFLGSYIESIAGSWNRKRSEPLPNGALNFLNTAMGALLVMWMSRSEWVIAILSR